MKNEIILSNLSQEEYETMMSVFNTAEQFCECYRQHLKDEDENITPNEYLESL